MDVRRISSVADYFVIATVTNRVHGRALEEALRTGAKKDAGIVARNPPERPGASWTVVGVQADGAQALAPRPPLDPAHAPAPDAVSLPRRQDRHDTRPQRCR